MGMASIRQRGGLSGFPVRAESCYDAFGVAHAGTSISAALGMAAGAALDDRKRKTVAVIGDGALTSGMAFEALNHLGETKSDVLVILNDNGMSISANVGALAQRFKPLHQGGSVEDAGSFFQALGLDYHGPVDGHDVTALLRSLRRLVPKQQPRVLHIITRKGSGYEPAEADPIKYHGVSGFDPRAGLKPKLATADAVVDKPPQTYTQVFSDWLCDMAASEPRLVAVTPAMREGSGLVRFAKQYPQRYFDAGIAEQHAVTLGAGLACEGLKPVVAIYSSFLQRAYDQLIHDVALQNLPVLFALDRGGLAGADGATHHGSFDLSYLRCIPNMVIMAPADENECRQMLSTGLRHDGPAAVRYPRGGGAGVSVDKSLEGLPIGKANVCRRGRKVALLAFGSLLDSALAAAEQLDASVANMRFIKPLDEDMVLELAAGHDLLVTLEDNAVAGGAGSAVNECLMANRVRTAVLNLGLPDRFVGHGTREQLLGECGLDEQGIVRVVSDYLDDSPPPQG
jgi:1-deoxy-D-xylulose-5-phosphate synthase